MTGVASAQIQGLGFEEGNGSIYSFAGATLVDTSASSGPDVITLRQRLTSPTAWCTSRRPPPGPGR